MDAYELANRINKQLNLDSPNVDECLKLLDELQTFCKISDKSEVERLRKECSHGEIFVMLAKGMKNERR